LRSVLSRVLSFPHAARPPPGSTLFPYTTLFRSEPLVAHPVGGLFGGAHGLHELVDDRARHRDGADEDDAGEVVEGQHHVQQRLEDRKSTRLNSSHVKISYAVFCLKKKTKPTST